VSYDPALTAIVILPCSGSMEPAFYRGDLLFLTNMASERYKTGDITVFKLPMQATPIVHRVIETHNIPEDSDIK
jgi:signal peptidase